MCSCNQGRLLCSGTCGQSLKSRDRATYALIIWASLISFGFITSIIVELSK